MSQPIDQRTALQLQLACIGGDEPETSFIEVRPLDPPARQWWIPVRKLDSAVDVISQLAAYRNVYVGAAPRVRQSGRADAVERVWALWVDCDSPESVERLRAFRPVPSIVNRSGSGENMHAWWQLRQPLAPEHAVRANRRLALALGADRAATDAARVMRPIGSLNHKTNPPRCVECVYLDLDSFTVADVVRGLADDPVYAPRVEPIRQRPSRNGGAALAGLGRVVRESSIGERNQRLNWSAFRAGQHAAAGTISPGDAEAELLDAALAAGLSEREALRTIASGLSAAGALAA